MSSASPERSNSSAAYSRIVSSIVNLGSSSLPSSRVSPFSVNDASPDRKVGLHRLRASHEQRNRLAAQQAVDVIAIPMARRRQRGDGIDVLGGEAKRSAARHEQLHAGRTTYKIRYRPCGRDQMFEVVEHEEQFAVAQNPGDFLCRRLATRRADPDSLRSGRQHKVGIVERRERNEHDTVSESAEKPCGGLEGDSRFPCSACTVNVTNRTAGRRRRPVTSSISRSRPMNDVGWGGKLPRAAASFRSGETGPRAASSGS